MKIQGKEIDSVVFKAITEAFEPKKAERILSRVRVSKPRTLEQHAAEVRKLVKRSIPVKIYEIREELIIEIHWKTKVEMRVIGPGA